VCEALPGSAYSRLTHHNTPVESAAGRDLITALHTATALAFREKLDKKRIFVIEVTRCGDRSYVFSKYSGRRRKTSLPRGERSRLIGRKRLPFFQPRACRFTATLGAQLR